MVRLVSRLIASLSTPMLLRLGTMLGLFWYYVIPIRRGEALKAVRRAFPEKRAAEHRAIVRANFVHLVRALLEVLGFISYPVERLKKLVRFETLVEPVLEARKQGKGTVCLSAHIGSFELSMGTFHFLSDGVPIIIVARVPKAGFARGVLDSVRDRTGMIVLGPKGSLPKVVKALTEEQRIFGFVTDQNMPRKRGVFVDFLGEVACTTPGFVPIAKKSGAIVMAGWNERLADGTHLGHFAPFALSEDPNPRVAMLNDTWRVSRMSEEWIRARPEQWFWVHRRWKTKPEPGDIVRGPDGVRVHGKGRVGVVLDRDGTITKEIGRSLRNPGEVELVPGAAAAIRRLNDAGIAVAVATNQAIVARGEITETELAAIHQRMKERLAEESGARIDRIFVCPHHPTEGKGDYLRACDCRKPMPGLLNQAAREMQLNPGVSLFVGDRDTDAKAALAAGFPCTLVSNGWAHKPWEPPTDAADIAESLPAAVDRFLEKLFSAAGGSAPQGAGKTEAKE